MVKLAEWVIRFRYPILACGIILWSAAGYFTGQITFNYSFWTLFVSDHPEVVRYRAYRDVWGEDSGFIFVALRSAQGDVTTVDNLRRIDAIENRIAGVQGVEDVFSPLTMTTVRGHGDELAIGPLVDTCPETIQEAAAFAHAALQSRLVAGVLLAENKRTAVVAVEVEGELRDARERNPVVIEAERIATEECAGTDLSVYMTGIPVAQWVYSSKMASDLTWFTSLALAFLAILLALVFRSLVGMFLPLLVVAAATTSTMATLVVTGGQINMINTAIPTLMLVIGLADGIHLLSHYRQKLGEGLPVRAAVKDMFVKLGSACFLTSVTTAVGFASLGLAQIGTVRTFGIYAAIGILYAYLANMLILPVGLTLLGPELGRRRAERPDTLMVRVLVSVGRYVHRRPRTALGASTVVLALALLGLLQVKIESRMFEEIPDDDPVVVAHRKLEEDLPGVTSYALDIETEPAGVTRPEVVLALDKLARAAEAHPSVDRAMGLPTLLKEMNRASHGGDDAYYRVPGDPALIAQFLLLAEGDATERILDVDHARTQIWMRGPESVTSRWEQLRADLEARLEALAPTIRGVVTGSSSMAKRALGSIVRDVLVSLVAASVIILLVMSLLFRSLRVGLISMVPNLVPLLMTVGAMGWAGINLRTSTVVIFSVALGLAVDDTIHFMVRYGRARREALGVPAAIERTMLSAGRPIVYTSILLMGGFWILLVSSFNATRDVGLLGGVTLLSALFADLIVLPALLTLFPGVGQRRSSP